MPAPTYQELLDFPANVSAAQKSILVADVTALIGADTTANAAAFVSGPLENADCPTNRISVNASAFTIASGQQVPATLNGKWFPCHYSGQLSFTVITPRDNTLARAEHGKRVGRILYLMQPEALRFNSTSLPYYEIVALTLVSVPETAQDADGNDRTEITFNAELWIRPGAFPATTP